MAFSMPPGTSCIPLRPGSGVAVVAASGPAEAGALQAGMDLLAERYRVVHAPLPGPAKESLPLPYLAAADRERAGQLNRALADPEVQAVFFSRGGYGAMRILPLLDAQVLRRRPLPLVGFSDVTALHAWAATLGVPSVHGPVVTQLPLLPSSQVQGLFDLLEGRALPRLQNLVPLRGGQASGPLLGGNLALLGHLCGTPYLPDLGGCILLLEEVNEPPYRLDRMLTQLRLSGQLERVSGVVVGSLTGCDGDLPGGDPVRAVLQDRLRDLGVPLVLGAPVGHGQENLALPLGGPPARLDADAGTLGF